MTLCNSYIAATSMAERTDRLLFYAVHLLQPDGLFDLQADLADFLVVQPVFTGFPQMCVVLDKGLGGDIDRADGVVEDFVAPALELVAVKTPRPNLLPVLLT